MKKIFIQFVFCFFTLSVFTQNDSYSELFKYLSDNKLFNGVVLVYDNEKIHCEKAYGYANVEWQIPLSTDCRFEIGSVTKQFTAMLVLQLIDEGKLKLESKINEFIPELPDELGKNITIHQLLAHTSGFPNHQAIIKDYMNHVRIPYLFNERIDQIKDSPLHFEPGSSWSYTGFGYTLLGEIVSRLTGKTLEENYYERIFKPLKMENSGCYFDHTLLPKKAYGYQQGWDGSFIQPEYYSRNEGNLGGGGLYSTANDMLIWHKALQNKELLSEDTHKKLFNIHYDFSNNDGYCYGFYFEKFYYGEKDSLNVYFHGGSIHGFSSLFLTIPEKNQCIILMHNTGMGREGFLQEIAFEILNIMYNDRFNLPKLDAAYLLAYTALYYDFHTFKKQFIHYKNKESTAYVVYFEQLLIIKSILEQLGTNDNVENILKFATIDYPDRYEGYYELGSYYINNQNNNSAIYNLKKAKEFSEDLETKAEIDKLIESIEGKN